MQRNEVPSWDEPQRIVQGSVSPFGIRLGITRSGGPRNSLRPVFTGRLVADPDGRCELAGTIGSEPAVLTLAVLLSVIGAVFFLACVSVGLISLATLNPAEALRALILAGIALPFLGVVAAILLTGARLRRADEDYLRQWLLDTLVADVKLWSRCRRPGYRGP